MSLRISTNVPSLIAQHQMSKTSKDLESGLSQLASGSRFSGPVKEPASQAISETLRGQAVGLTAASRNADVATSFIQTAEGSLNEQNNILIRMRELGVQSASDTYSDVERGFMQMEFSQLTEEFDRIAKSTKFGGASLLSGSSKNYEFQVGEHGGATDRIVFNSSADTRADEVGVADLSVAEKGDARDALGSIDEALMKVGSERARFGATQSRLESAQDFLAGQISAITEAKSKVGDTDVAAAVSQVRRAQILQQYQASVLAQANQSPEAALKLIV